MAWNWLEWLKHVGARNVLLASYQSDVDTHLLEWGVPCVDISEFVGIDPTGAPAPLSTVRTIHQPNAPSSPAQFGSMRDVHVP